MSHGGFDIKYNWIDGAESLENYMPGGYHPIMIGDILHDRYCIVDKLGFGEYSTIWLARDTQMEHYVAVKVGIANLESDSLLHETKSLRALSTPLPSSASRQQYLGRDSIPCLLDEFKVHGPNGTHVCYTTIPARCNLSEVSFSRLFPLDVARALSGGLTLALVYTHSQGYVHGDIHLQNVLVKLPSSFDQLSIDRFYEKYGKPEAVTTTRRDGKPLSPNIPPKAVLPPYLGKKAGEFKLSDVRILLSDFGEAFAPASDFRCGEDCNTPLAFRSPEARFEPQVALSYPADIWSLATAIWEIIDMKAIFSTDG
ncbi:serine/threonine protein kinase [Polytolypa hystricis UAMH7299]|uniref:non-specific serine/threonine protein kinase n=1 Tax=Polytolypa hystricis (strain UAMH7299) TaxID=1447883 RepID=A0A2B7XWQ4_POLH7|nr:serine/threonine protein kinase [Polytolypa hystricis UAMH7299]